MTLNHQHLWSDCLAIIKDNVTEAQYNTWFRSIVPLHYENKELTIQVPTHFVYEHLEEKYVSLLREVLYRVFGQGVQLMYQVVVENETPSTMDVAGSTASTKVGKSVKKYPKGSELFNHLAVQELDSQLNPNYTFENYFQGHSNKLAHSVGTSIAAMPGTTAFNPLFVFGESGVGKTHLLHAIGVRIKENNPLSRVLYLSSHLFQVQYTDAVRNNTVNDFINFYQTIDVLLIDDIQDLAGKTQTQNTFFHIFNHLHQNGKQLVMSSDRPPVSLQGIVPRLLSRFKWGLPVEIERPDFELRREILKNKIRHNGLSIPEEVVNYVAEQVRDNVRDLESVIVSLMARATLLNRDITIDLAQKVLATSVVIEKKQITIDAIQEKVCGYFHLSPKDLQAKSRKGEIVQARQLAMYFAKKHMDLSYARIGELIGRKDHATVLHACKKITDQLAIDKKFKSVFEEIQSQILSNH